MAHEEECDNVRRAEGEPNLPMVPKEVQKCKMLIMTSYENHSQTVQFFRQNAFFGGSEDSFEFFPQSVLPAFDT